MTTNLCGTNCFREDESEESIIRFLEAIATDDEEDLSGVCTIFIPLELTCRKEHILYIQCVPIVWVIFRVLH